MHEDKITAFVEENISAFHENRLIRLRKLKLDSIISRKNPYLFRAKNVADSREFVSAILDAYLSSQEETIFGNFLEQLAIYVCTLYRGGRKSGIEGIDLEFDSDNVRYIISIKSGPNWGNSSQISKLRDNFKKAAKVLRTSSSKLNIRAVNGCCYGIDKKPDKGDYYKFCGQQFWALISGDSDLYSKIIEPLGVRSDEFNTGFQRRYESILEKFTKQFERKYCVDGQISWPDLVRYVSSVEV